MFIWPDTDILPAPSTDLGHQHESSVIRTNMDSGRVRQRLRFTSGWRSIPVSWEFTDSEYAIFQAILAHRLNFGADWFQMELPMGAKAGDPAFTLETVRFVGAPIPAKYKDVMHWKVTAVLETENVAAISSEDLATILGED